MKYIVTGATSFVGLEFTQLLLTQGHSVIAVCRKNSSSLPKLPLASNLSVVYAEMSEYNTLDDKISNADIFVNFAWDGTKNTTDRDFGDVHVQNIYNTIEAYKAADRIGCKLFVEAGSQAEYGIVKESIYEDLVENPLTEYGKAKLEVKRQCFLLSETSKMKYLHLRIFSIFGENDHSRTLVMSSLKKMIDNEPVDLSTCEQMWNFIYVKDAAKQIMLLCNYAVKNTAFQHEIFNIASEDTRVLMDYVEDMLKITGSHSKLNFGVYKSNNPVTLNPDVTKTKNAIGFISEYSFEEIIPRIIKKITNK